MFDVALRVIGWLLVGTFVLWLFVLGFAGFREGEVPFGMNQLWLWVIGAFYALNAVASAIAVLCVIFTSSGREMRGTWMLAFVAGALLLGSVFLVPLFRHYALRGRE